MKIAAVLMQKNEADLLPIWVGYYGEQFGRENLFIHDNGSDDPQVLAFLDRIEAEGVFVERRFDTPEDFANKGGILAAKIRQLDAEAPRDFYFPLDCDEFLGVRDEKGNVSFEMADIEAELRPHLDCPDVLTLAGGYDNHPGEPGRYVYKGGRKKCFFARDACVDLDLGFHRGRSKTGQIYVPTRLVNAHFHFKPFDTLRAHARQKLVGRVPDFREETLRAHKEARGKGMHLVDHLLYPDEAAYVAAFTARFRPGSFVPLPGLERKMAALDLPVPFSGG
ncbi:glycosyltransferase family 2 protein [Muricoccus radiodurans]|uniref:glycosyltransferase family 2 protein n=1 Tax=Muricoccus radiodurans TaxID=2231721 RepID=UPI003CE9CB0B